MTEFVLLPTEAEAVYPAAAASKANEIGMKAAAEHYGVSYSKLRAFIADAGYSLVRTHQWQLQLPDDKPQPEDDPDEEISRQEAFRRETEARATQPEPERVGFGAEEF